jgi:hypothetical protein
VFSSSGTTLAEHDGMSQSHRLRLVAGALGAATLMALASGCYADAGAEPEYVEASAPVDIEVAPHYEYEGRTVYYSNDRWYAQDRGRWVYYRDEPQPLYRQRTHVAEAPRAREERRVAQPRQEAPRAREERRVAQPRQEAPRAREERRVAQPRQEAPRAREVQ